MYTQGDMAIGAPNHPTSGTAGAHTAADAIGSTATGTAGARAADTVGASGRSAGSGGNSSPVFTSDSILGVDGKSVSGERSVGVLRDDISVASSSSANDFSCFFSFFSCCVPYIHNRLLVPPLGGGQLSMKKCSCVGIKGVGSGDPGSEPVDKAAPKRGGQTAAATPTSFFTSADAKLRGAGGAAVAGAFAPTTGATLPTLPPPAESAPPPKTLSPPAVERGDPPLT